MQDRVRYKEWLRARGVENASEDDLRLLGKKAKSNPRASLLEFLAYMWMDAEVGYAGTRRWLGLQGLLEPTRDDLIYFHGKIRSTVAWRGTLLVALLLSWFTFLWVEGIRMGGLNLVPPISAFIYGLTHTFGAKLPGRSPTQATPSRTIGPGGTGAPRIG